MELGEGGSFSVKRDGKGIIDRKSFS